MRVMRKKSPQQVDSGTTQELVSSGDLGAYLQAARERAGYSQADVAKKLGLSQFQSISQWERNASGSVPLRALKKLIELYGLPAEEVYEVLLKFQTNRLEQKLESRFFGRGKKGRSA